MYNQQYNFFENNNVTTDMICNTAVFVITKISFANYNVDSSADSLFSAIYNEDSSAENDYSADNYSSATVTSTVTISYKLYVAAHFVVINVISSTDVTKTTT